MCKCKTQLIFGADDQAARDRNERAARAYITERGLTPRLDLVRPWPEIGLQSVETVGGFYGPQSRRVPTIGAIVCPHGWSVKDNTRDTRNEFGNITTHYYIEDKEQP